MQIRFCIIDGEITWGLSCSISNINEVIYCVNIFFRYLTLWKIILTYYLSVYIVCFWELFGIFWKILFNSSLFRRLSFRLKITTVIKLEMKRANLISSPSWICSFSFDEFKEREWDVERLNFWSKKHFFLLNNLSTLYLRQNATT